MGDGEPMKVVSSEGWKAIIVVKNWLIQPQSSVPPSVKKLRYIDGEVLGTCFSRRPGEGCMRENSQRVLSRYNSTHTAVIGIHRVHVGKTGRRCAAHPLSSCEPR